MKRLKYFLPFLFTIFLSSPLFAQGIVPQGMQNLTDQILEVFTGPLVRTILIIIFVATGIVFAYNKDNEKMKRNCIAIFVGIAIVGIGGEVVRQVWNAAGLR